MILLLYQWDLNSALLSELNLTARSISYMLFRVLFLGLLATVLVNGAPAPLVRALCDSIQLMIETL